MPAPRILISKADLAQKAGRSRATIGKLCLGRLKPALVRGKVDAGHPAVVQYLSERGIDQTAPAPSKAKRLKVDGHKDDGTPGSISSLSALTLGEIARRFGGEEEFSAWLKDAKLVEDIRERRLKNEETEGSLISRTLVVSALLGLIEEQNQRLLSELPKTLARTLHAHAAAGIPLEQSEREIRQTLGKTLENTKSKVTRRLKSN